MYKYAYKYTHLTQIYIYIYKHIYSVYEHVYMNAFTANTFIYIYIYIHARLCILQCHTLAEKGINNNKNTNENSHTTNN